MSTAYFFFSPIINEYSIFFPPATCLQHNREVLPLDILNPNGRVQDVRAEWRWATNYARGGRLKTEAIVICNPDGLICAREFLNLIIGVCASMHVRRWQKFAFAMFGSVTPAT